MAAILRSQSSNSASGGTVTVTRPASLAAGDLLIAQVGLRGNTGVFTPPDGFTEVTGGRVLQSTTLTHQVYYKIASAADAVAADFTFTSTVTGSFQVGLTAWSSGFSSADPIGAVAVQGNGSTTTAGITAGLTPENANSTLVFAVYTDQEDTVPSGYAITTDNPDSWAEAYNVPTLLGADSTLALAYADRTTASATGAWGVTYAVARASALIALTINPVEGGSPSMSPSASASPSASVSPSASASMSPSVSPSSSSSRSQSPSASASPSSSISPSPSPSAAGIPLGVLSLFSGVLPNSSQSPSSSMSASASSSVSRSPSRSASPSVSPSSSASPSSSVSPSPSAGGLTLPTGIPAPPFGLLETVAGLYGDANYYTHWVDNTHPNTGATGNGTPTNPRSTFPTMTSLAAGSVIQVRGGPYSLGANMQIAGTGTANNPIIITAGQTPTVTLNLNGSRSVQIGGSYHIFEGFITTNQDEAVLIAGDHNVFRYNEVVGTLTATDGNGAMVSPGGSTYAVMAWNTVRDGGDRTSTTENDMHGLGIGFNHTDTWYLWNHVYNVSGDAIGNAHASNFSAHHLFIGGNELHSCGENALDLKETHSIIFSENECYDYLPSASGQSPGEAVVIHYGPNSSVERSPYNCWLINNTIYDCVYGIVSTEVSNNSSFPGAWWIGNKVYDCSVGLNPDRGGGVNRLYHNTVVDCDMGISQGSTSGGAQDGLAIHGNIVSNVNTSSAYHFQVASSSVTPIVTASHECYWQGGANVRIRLGSNTYTSVAAWIAGTSIGDNSIQADPLFLNPTAHDYNLGASSPCLNAGFDMSALEDTFVSAFAGYSVSLLRDLDGNERPDGVWDMGAFQRS
jgi:hypothetical protein